MDQDRQRWLADRLERLAEDIREIDGFMGDNDLKSAYMIVHSAKAAVMFNELQSLGQSCADWCGEQGDKVIAAG
jgi:hypothetical protein